MTIPMGGDEDRLVVIAARILFHNDESFEYRSGSGATLISSIDHASFFLRFYQVIIENFLASFSLNSNQQNQ
ncbi:hypothetical protein DYI25_05225 [Mesobacillus boroniphilus]|uniref:Uncharacterized protein n=1 Tax=Mesobacillus boroniphilus TaxID=308892 RepID=A0A944CK06_9BACI|nr:hypothetical protein [Mesobacillus boroniphilus]